jgi:DNA-binding LacI/PurR family transcriptional regulator
MSSARGGCGAGRTRRSTTRRSTTSERRPFDLTTAGAFMTHDGRDTGREARSPRARLSDVAAAANVSKSIASRILNGYPGLSVREETRLRVVEAARRLDYHPHAGALAVARAQTGALAFLVPPLSNPVYVRIVRGAFAEALRHDLVVLLVEDLDPKAARDTLTRLVRSGRVDGLIIASATPRHPLVRALRSDDAIPHVFVNRAVPGSDRNVTMDDARASVAAWNHLAELGHRRVGLVAGPADVEPSRRRQRAFVTEAARGGVEVPVEHADFVEAAGARAAHALLDREPALTALYSNSLSQAVGVLRAARVRGLAVPARLSVITYDDMPLADHLVPSLTTVRMPLAELGAAAVAAVVAQLKGERTGDVVVETRPEVLVRESTAPPPSVDRRGVRPRQEVGERAGSTR